MRTFFVLLALLGLAQTAFAETDPNPKALDNEVSLALAQYAAQTGEHPEFTLGTASNGISYGRVLTSFLEINLKVVFDTYASTVQAPGGTKFTVTLGPIFNFPVDDQGIANAFFVSLGAGIGYQRVNSFSFPGTLFETPAVVETDFAYDFEVGKRFSLLPNVSYSPTLFVMGSSGTDIYNDYLVHHPGYGALPVRVSILF